MPPKASILSIIGHRARDAHCAFLERSEPPELHEASITSIIGAPFLLPESSLFCSERNLEPYRNSRCPDAHDVRRPRKRMLLKLKKALAYAAFCAFRVISILHPDPIRNGCRKQRGGFDDAGSAALRSGHWQARSTALTCCTEGRRLRSTVSK